MAGRVAYATDERGRVIALSFDPGSGVDELARGMPVLDSVEDVDAQNTEFATDGLKALLTKLPSLKRIDLRGCSAISDEDGPAILDAHNTLELVHVGWPAPWPPERAADWRRVLGKKVLVDDTLTTPALGIDRWRGRLQW